MPEIPTQLRTAAEALDAIGGYVAWRASLPNPFRTVPYLTQVWDEGYKGPPVPPWGVWDHSRKLYAQLDSDPGPPPVLHTHPDGQDVRRVPTDPHAAGTRGSHTVRVPAGAYGPQIDQPLAELTTLARDVQLARAFAARCDALAELETARGRVRQAEKFATEASELSAFADQLEADAVPVLGDAWLSEWRAAAIKYTPQTPRLGAPTRPVQLR